MDAEFLAQLQVVEDSYYSEHPQGSSPPPPASSPPMASSLTLSQPSTESLLALSTLDEWLPTVRHWVVFHGCVLGIYVSS